MKRIAIAAAAVLTAVAARPVAGAGGDHKLLILLNSADTLYKVDPDTFDLTSLGTFSFPGLTIPDRITDIAVDRKGRMWAVGFEAVYSVDRKTLECTLLMRQPGQELNGLAIVTGSMVSGRELPDLMVATEAESSTVYEVDRATGALTQLGDMGGGLSSSGDLTWAPGVGAVQITTDRAGYEGLSRLEPTTFVAHKIGPGWAFSKVRALTMLPHGLLAATEQGELLEVDPATGDATLRKTEGVAFYGGAVGWDE